MKFVIVGLGSMGKRRIRCLQKLGYTEITGVDTRADRRLEAETTYNIATIASTAEVPWREIDAVIVSTPPDLHIDVLDVAVKHGKPVFVEASVILAGLENIRQTASERGAKVYPSCTLRFHSAIRDIKRIVTSGNYGKVTNFTYHCGQYLPDWHPWEDIRDFYVSKRETGACREIVPFELTWLLDVLGRPEAVTGYYGKTFDMGVDIDDTYAMTFRFPGFFGTMIVDAVARYAIRSLILNLEKAQITWRWDQQFVSLYESDTQRTVIYNQPQPQSAAGYNKNIGEQMYIDEVASFIADIEGKGTYPNTLEDDIAILTILNRFEGNLP